MAYKRTLYRLKQQTKRRKQNKTHPIFFILLLIFLLHKQNKSKFYTNSQVCPATNSLYLFYKPYSPTSRMPKKHHPTFVNSSQLAALVFLLLLNDIHPNPGPISQVNLLRCEDCKTITPIKSTIQNLERGFEWICPNKNCLPNYHIKPLPKNEPNNKIITT